MKPRNRLSFRILRSPRPFVSFVHPLELHDTSDSEVESVLDSHSDSVLSLTSLDLSMMSVLPVSAGCMSCVTPAVVLVPFVSANVQPGAVLTRSKLLALLESQSDYKSSKTSTTPSMFYNIFEDDTECAVMDDVWNYGATDTVIGGGIYSGMNSVSQVGNVEHPGSVDSVGTRIDGKTVHKHTVLGRCRTFYERLMALTLVLLSPRSTDDGPFSGGYCCEYDPYSPKQRESGKRQSITKLHHKDCLESGHLCLDSCPHNPRFVHSKCPRLKDLHSPCGPRQPNPELPGQELVTFSSRAPDPVVVAVTRAKARNREFRINSEFLRRYALDYAARQSHVLPLLGSPEEHDLLMQLPAVRLFHAKHDVHRVGAMSRDKLWESVILPPRSDLHPLRSIDYSSYRHDRPACHHRRMCVCTVATKHTKYIPWATHRMSMKPAGILGSVRPMESKTSPTARATPAQYTIRGWSNARWSDD